MYGTRGKNLGRFGVQTPRGCMFLVFGSVAPTHCAHGADSMHYAGNCSSLDSSNAPDPVTHKIRKHPTCIWGNSHIVLNSAFRVFIYCLFVCFLPPHSTPPHHPPPGASGLCNEGNHFRLSLRGKASQGF